MKPLFVLVAVVVAAQASSKKSVLTRSLLEGYESRSPPDGLVGVQLGMEVLHMALNPTKQGLSTVAWMAMLWDDGRLSWNATKWGISSLRIPQDQVWLPDMAVYNAVDELSVLQPPELNRVVVYPTGRLSFVPAVEMKSLCEIDFEHYPRGTQNCTIKIGSWTTDSTLIDVFPKKGGKGISFDHLPTNAIEIEDSSVKEVVDGGKYKHLAYNIVFKQKPTYDPEASAASPGKPRTLSLTERVPASSSPISHPHRQQEQDGAAMLEEENKLKFKSFEMSMTWNPDRMRQRESAKRFFFKNQDFTFYG